MYLADYHHDVRRNAAFAWTGPSGGRRPGLLAFAAQTQHLRAALANPDLVALLVSPELAEHPALEGVRIGLAVDLTPRATFFALHNFLAQAQEAAHPAPEVHKTAQVHASAVLERGCRIGAGVEVGAGAVIGRCTEVGAHAFVGEGACVGVAGHFDQHDAAGRRMRVRHMGSLHVGEGAQVHAGAIVQRDVYAVVTEIGRDAVVGPGVQMGHGASLGPDAVLAGGTVVAGYTRIGPRAWCGPNVTLGNNLEIGADARVEIGAVVVRSVPDGARVSGNFATDHRANVRRQMEVVR